MKPKPNVDQFLGQAGNATAATPATAIAEIAADQIVMLQTAQLRPNEKQDRDDMDSEAAIEYIRSLADSMLLDLPNGRKYGVRRPIEVRPADSAGVHEIIAGENRWRAAGLAKLAEVPCVIKTGGDVEARIDHVTDNALHRTLTLWQQANSIRRDQEDYGLTTEQIIAAHGLRNKTQLSKLMSVFKLSEEAQSFVKKGYVQDVNLIYELKKLPDEQLSKLAKRVIDKGESFPAALKALQPKEPKEPKNKPSGGAEDGQQTNDGTPPPAAEHVALRLKPAAAKALAILLDIEGSEELNAAALTEQLQQRLDSMADEGEGA